jgi:hypothetical protein
MYENNKDKDVISDFSITTERSPEATFKVGLVKLASHGPQFAYVTCISVLRLSRRSVMFQVEVVFWVLTRCMWYTTTTLHGFTTQKRTST